jgi:hypothetical protein
VSGRGHLHDNARVVVQHDDPRLIEKQLESDRVVDVEAAQQETGA